MTIVTVGIDLAKNVIAAHDVNEAGKPAFAREHITGHANLPSLVTPYA